MSRDGDRYLSEEQPASMVDQSLIDEVLAVVGRPLTSTKTRRSPVNSRKSAMRAKLTALRKILLPCFAQPGVHDPEIMHKAAVMAATVLHEEPPSARRDLIKMGFKVRTYILRPGAIVLPPNNSNKKPILASSTELYLPADLVETFGKGMAYPKGGAVVAQLTSPLGVLYEAKVNCAATRQFNGKVLCEAAIMRAYSHPPVQAFRWTLDSPEEA